MENNNYATNSSESASVNQGWITTANMKHQPEVRPAKPLSSIYYLRPKKPFLGNGNIIISNSGTLTEIAFKANSIYSSRPGLLSNGQSIGLADIYLDFVAVIEVYLELNITIK
jgi:hypothetical protein